MDHQAQDDFEFTDTIKILQNNVQTYMNTVAEAVEFIQK